ncbi:LysR substrate-binding domain-containing protein [Nonomuraea rhodomycinica]|uniref:LysR substrate-binding domain-containing protein n=1 Tax=Nonomuraea rhodomycinica TaxID=1712872 RepID=UPI0035E43718
MCGVPAALGAALASSRGLSPGQPVHLADFAHEHWLMPGAETSCHEITRRACGAAGFVPRTIVTANDFSVLSCTRWRNASTARWRPTPGPARPACHGPGSWATPQRRSGRDGHSGRVAAFQQTAQRLVAEVCGSGQAGPGQEPGTRIASTPGTYPTDGPPPFGESRTYSELPWGWSHGPEWGPLRVNPNRRIKRCLGTVGRPLPGGPAGQRMPT